MLCGPKYHHDPGEDSVCYSLLKAFARDKLLRSEQSSGKQQLFLSNVSSDQCAAPSAHFACIVKFPNSNSDAINLVSSNGENVAPINLFVFSLGTFGSQGNNPEC